MTKAEILPGPVWLVGCGNMAGAMLTGWLAAGADPRQFTAIRPSGAPVAEGVRVLTAMPQDEAPALVLLGFKPQTLDAVVPRLAPVLEPECLLVSILTGVDLALLKARFPTPDAIFKAMPSLPVALNKGVVELVTRSGDAQAKAIVERLMSAIGEVVWFKDEALMSVASAISAAGPAFLFRFIDALAAAGEQLGLPAEQSARLAALMAEGAGALAVRSGETPHQLARRVASPGGTTEAGLKVLDDEDGLKSLMLRAIEASGRRGKEMAAAARGE